jgi:DNA integrity scanning protein DisA with diadenylate cyclase activity
MHLSNYLFYILPIASAIPFLASLTLFFQPTSERYLKHFSIFLFINCIMDTITDISALNSINNIFFNNLVQMFVLSFQLYLLREIVRGRKAKKVFLYFLLTYLLLSMANFFLVQKTSVFNTMTFSLGSLLIVSASIYYFWELFQSRSFVNLVRQPSFWICSGLLFYYVCNFPLTSLLNFIHALPNVILQNLLIIFLFLNIFLYLSFTIAFLCRLKTRKSMQ